MGFVSRIMKRLSAPQKTAVQLCAVILTMGALAWASVPFYDWFYDEPSQCGL